MPANPKAIAWYVERSERLLGDLRDEVQSFRTRGVQLAGFSGAILALVGANAESILGALGGGARVCAGSALLTACGLLVAAFVTSLRPRSVQDLSRLEVGNYTSDRFIEEPDLWRVQARTIRGLAALIEDATHLEDEASNAIGTAERLLAAGLSVVGIALAILVLVVTF